MKFTLSWLKAHLETDANLDEIASILTSIGLEVEEIIDLGVDLAAFKVAEIIEANPHPDADKLQVCKVNTGEEILQIVCGAPNARAGIKVVLAPVGALIPAGDFKIKKSKIRGVESCGMMCSAAELDLGADSAGIIELGSEAVIGDIAVKSLGMDDPVIEIAITPNRGDCLGVRGIARDLAAAGLGTLKPLVIQEVRGTFESAKKVSITTDKSSLFIGRSFSGVKNGESPKWLKQRLESIGQVPISALVDITNFLAYDLGRPAHVFDEGKLADDIIVRASKKGELFTALNEVQYTLPEDVVAVTDSQGVQALGGIIGGMESSCTETTEEVFLEIALFDPIAVAHAGRVLQVDTDSRYRFERGLDSGFVQDSVHYASQLILDICGGEASELVIAGDIPDKGYSRLIEMDEALIAKRTGLNLESELIDSILVKLGFGITRNGGELVLTVPTWRNDITIAEDITEEVARIYGYDKIAAVPLPLPHIREPAVRVEQKRESMVRRSCAQLGLNEVISFSFMNSKHVDAFLENKSRVELSNPISSDLNIMRPSIVPNLLQMVQKNQARGSNSTALFEVGPVFYGDIPGQQQQVAAGVRSGMKAEKSHYHDEREFDCFDAKADIMEVLNIYLPSENLRVNRDAPSYYHPGRSGALLLGKKVLGYFGELHPSILKQIGVKGRAVAFEAFLEEAPKAKSRKTTARPKLDISNYQSVERDFAFVVKDNIDAGDMLSVVRKSEKNLIDNISIFDIYRGKGVEDGKKSVAIKVRMQPKNRTLTDEEIEQVSQTIINNMAKSVEAVLR